MSSYRLSSLFITSTLGEGEGEEVGDSSGEGDGCDEFTGWVLLAVGDGEGLIVEVGDKVTDGSGLKVVVGVGVRVGVGVGVDVGVGVG
ncbi:MAG: hypothetical protein GX584_03485 [Clostridiaceae bacterium]|nr:hypothetical protein [Clostridiaceae bacterium]